MDLSTLKSFPLTNALVYQCFNFHPFMDHFEWHDLTYAWFDVTWIQSPTHSSQLHTPKQPPGTDSGFDRASLSILSGAGNFFKRISSWQSSSRVESNDCFLSQVNTARNLECTFSFWYCFQSYNFPLSFSSFFPQLSTHYHHPAHCNASKQNKTKQKSFSLAASAAGGVIH